MYRWRRPSSEIGSVLIDREAKTVRSGIASAPASFEENAAAGPDIAELTLSASPATVIQCPATG